MLKLNVPDMTCGHCAGVVTKAVKASMLARTFRSICRRRRYRSRAPPMPTRSRTQWRLQVIPPRRPDCRRSFTDYLNNGTALESALFHLFIRLENASAHLQATMLEFSEQAY